jgi:hypothetical protein
MNELEKIVKNIDDEKINRKYIDSKQLIEYVESFIKRKSLILYGGFAINLLMPKKYKFYKSFTINDFDCYSINAKEDAKELAKELANNNYPYIKVKKALHENTYKVYVNFLQVIDITQISKEEYDCLKKTAEYEKVNTKLYKYYKETFTIAPVMYLKTNMHYELSRPLNSYFRWEKVFYRMQLLTRLFNFKNINILEEHLTPSKSFKKVMKYIKTNDNVIIGKNAFKYYGITKEYDIQIDILSINPQETKDAIIKLLNLNSVNGTKTIVKNKRDYYIVSDGIIHIKIINTKEDCYSYFKVNGYLIGSYDTVLYYLYNDYLQNIVDDNIDGSRHLFQYISALEYYLNNSIQNDPSQRLGTDCFGKYTSLKDILAKKWKKRQTIVYY